MFCAPTAERRRRESSGSSSSSSARLSSLGRLINRLGDHTECMRYMYLSKGGRSPRAQPLTHGLNLLSQPSSPLPRKASTFTPDSPPTSHQHLFLFRVSYQTIHTNYQSRRVDVLTCSARAARDGRQTGHLPVSTRLLAEYEHHRQCRERGGKAPPTAQRGRVRRRWRGDRAEARRTAQSRCCKADDAL